MSTKPTHLTQHQRSVIEALLSEQNSLRHIADRIAKAPSTVSREVRNLLSSVIYTASSDNHFALLHFFFLWDGFDH